MDSGRVGMSQEWSRVVSAEVKKEYKTLQGIQTHCSQLTSQNQKTVKSHLSLTLMRVKLVPIWLWDLGFNYYDKINVFFRLSQMTKRKRKLLMITSRTLLMRRKKMTTRNPQRFSMLRKQWMNSEGYTKVTSTES